MDTADGEKIVSHVFGGQQDQVASQLAGTAQLGGVGGDLVRKLLPILAPIVMSYLANKVLGGRGQSSGAGGTTGPGRPAGSTSAAFWAGSWAVRAVLPPAAARAVWATCWAGCSAAASGPERQPSPDAGAGSRLDPQSAPQSVRRPSPGPAGRRRPAAG